MIKKLVPLTAEEIEQARRHCRRLQRRHKSRPRSRQGSRPLTYWLDGVPANRLARCYHAAGRLMSGRERMRHDARQCRDRRGRGPGVPAGGRVDASAGGRSGRPEAAADLAGMGGWRQAAGPGADTAFPPFDRPVTLALRHNWATDWGKRAATQPRPSKNYSLNRLLAGGLGVLRPLFFVGAWSGEGATPRFAHCTRTSASSCCVAFSPRALSTPMMY
jgi:hypothetical protein